MLEKILIGVDIGGTTIKFACVSQAGEIIHKWKIETNTTYNGRAIPMEIAHSIEEQIQRLSLHKSSIAGIGVGAPGPVHLETGSIDVAINLGWSSFPLTTMLEKVTGLHVIVDNDANLAALGEMWKGAGAGAKDIVCITLGTGVGGGIITNGQLIHGVNGSGGEIGHTTVIPEGGAPCNCGKTGCLETVASATGIVRLANEIVKQTNAPSLLRERLRVEQTITSKWVLEAAAKGDALANEVLRTVTFHLGLALANIANATNPAKIVIGGGVSKAGDLLLQPVKEYVQRFTFPRVADGLEVVLASLGNDAGVIGGAALAKHTFLSNQ